MFVFSVELILVSGQMDDGKRVLIQSVFREFQQPEEPAFSSVGSEHVLGPVDGPDSVPPSVVSGA